MGVQNQVEGVETSAAAVEGVAAVGDPGADHEVGPEGASAPQEEGVPVEGHGAVGAHQGVVPVGGHEVVLVPQEVEGLVEGEVPVGEGHLPRGDPEGVSGGEPVGDLEEVDHEEVVGLGEVEEAPGVVPAEGALEVEGGEDLEGGPWEVGGEPENIPPAGDAEASTAEEGWDGS